MSSLEISHLKVSLGNRLILDDLSFSLAEGQIAALLGPSGCGKTTLLRSIAGLIQPSDGTIRFGKQLVSLSSLVMPSHKRKIGYVPQEGALFPHLNIADNISFGIDTAIFTKDQIRQTTKEMLALTGMEGFGKRMPHQLSGGQQQRLCIARSLAVNPQVLLMDEPCSALDPGSTLRIEETVRELSASMSIVIVTHNMQQAARVSDYTGFFLSDGGPGRLIESGTTEEIFTNPKQKRTEDYVSGRFG